MERNVDDIIKLVDGARGRRACCRSAKGLTGCRHGLTGRKFKEGEVS